jgi:hypothetical protein
MKYLLGIAISVLFVSSAKAAVNGSCTLTCYNVDQVEPTYYWVEPDVSECGDDMACQSSDQIYTCSAEEEGKTKTGECKPFTGEGNFIPGGGNFIPGSGNFIPHPAKSLK